MHRSALVALTLLGGGTAIAQPQPGYSIIKAGFVMHSMSSDGRTLVGQAQGAPAAWNVSHGLTKLPLSVGNTQGAAEDVTADGRIIVGQDGSSAALWNRGVLTVLRSDSKASFVSNDGTRMAGVDGNSRTWYYNGSYFAEALIPNLTSMSGNGHFLTGQDIYSLNYWNTTFRSAVKYKFSPVGDGSSSGGSLSFDGNNVYGITKCRGSYYFVEYIHKVPITSVAGPKQTAVADDNTAAAAESVMYFPASKHAVPLVDVLASNGLSALSNALTAMKVVSISGDGSVLAGTGVDSKNALVSWRAQLGLYGTPDLYKLSPNDSVFKVAAPGVLGNDVLSLGGTAVLLSQPAEGTLTLASDGSFDYTPNHYAVGRYTFTYKIVKNGMSSDPITVVLKVGVPTKIVADPAIIPSGGSTYLYVYLNYGGGYPVKMTSSKPGLVNLPSSVKFNSGEPIEVSANNVSTTTTTTISATVSESSVSTTLTVAAHSPYSLTFDSPTVQAGARAVGHVILWRPVPAGGYSYAISSSNTSAATVPAHVAVPAGATSFDFNISTLATPTPENVAISVLGDSLTVKATLVVRLPTVTSVSTPSPTIVSGNVGTATVTLETPAPRAYVVTVNGVAYYVPQGQRVWDLSFTAPKVVSSTTFTVTAKGEDGTSVATKVKVVPASFLSFSASPNPIVGGSTAVGHNTWNGSPDETQAVTYTSSNTAVVPTPKATAVDRDASIVTNAVTVATTVTLTSTYKGITRSTTLKVLPPS